jgi:hypothetical protein
MALFNGVLLFYVCSAYLNEIICTIHTHHYDGENISGWISHLAFKMETNEGVEEAG